MKSKVKLLFNPSLPQKYEPMNYLKNLTVCLFNREEKTKHCDTQTHCLKTIKIIILFIKEGRNVKILMLNGQFEELNMHKELVNIYIRK